MAWLSPEQRLELGKHETASVASVGIWLEFLLMRMLAKVAYQGDPASRHVQYALAEMAEECRHSTMFARMIEWIGVPAYGPRLRTPARRMLPDLAHGPAMWGAILIGEEVTDRFQREMVGDESVQPLVRMVNRIHIVEEARHIGFARAELGSAGRRAESCPTTGCCSRTRLHRLPQPDQSARVRLGRARPARGAPSRAEKPAPRETLRFGGEKIMAFLEEAGLVGGPVCPFWRGYVPGQVAGEEGGTASADAVSVIGQPPVGGRAFS